MSPIVALLVLVVVLTGGMWYLERLIRDPRVAIYSVAVAVTLGYAFRDAAAINVVGFRIGVLDLISVLLVIAAIARHLRVPMGPWGALVRLLVLLVFIGLLRGVPEFGDKAFNEFRGYLEFAGTLFYFSSVRYDDENRVTIAKGLVATALGVSVVVLLRWAARLTGVDLGPMSAEFDHVIRVLSGPESYLFADLLILTAAGYGGREFIRNQRGLTIFFAVMTLALNRRTMWAATVVALTVLAVRDRDWGKRLVSAFLVGGVLVTAAYFVFPQDALDAEEGLAAGATTTGTLEWRIEGWVDLLTQPREGIDWVVGQPFGTGFERETFGRRVTTNPHNYYVQTLLRTGAIGLAILLLLYGAGALALLRRRDPSAWDGLPLPPEVLLAIVAGHVVWYGAWQSSPTHGVLLGTIVACLWTVIPDTPRRRRQRLTVDPVIRHPSRMPVSVPARVPARDAGTD